jgi:hypothetical protein
VGVVYGGGGGGVYIYIRSRVIYKIGVWALGEY